jgi:hypothetical protein
MSQPCFNYVFVRMMTSNINFNSGVSIAPLIPLPNSPYVSSQTFLHTGVYNTYRQVDVGSRGSSVSIVTKLWGWMTRFDSWLEFFFLTTASRPPLGPIQLPIQWIPEALSPGLKRPGREDDNSLHLGATPPPPPPYVFTTWCLIKHRIHPHGVVLS